MSNTITQNRLVDHITDKRFHLVAQIADAIVDTVLSAGSCQQEDIYNKGFKPQDIVAFWHFADALASVEIKLLTEGRNTASVQRVDYA